MAPLTKARRGALHVLAGGPARYSNETIITADGRNVYHQTTDWLIEQGLAIRSGDYVELTILGMQRWRAENAGQFA